MAKIFDLVSKSYTEIRVVPAIAKTAGNIDTYGSVYGFYLVDHSAAQALAGEEATLILKADSVKVTKTLAQAWVPGEPVYWDAGTSKVTNVAAALPIIGYVAKDAALNDASGFIIFDGTANFEAQMS